MMSLRDEAIQRMVDGVMALSPDAEVIDGYRTAVREEVAVALDGLLGWLREKDELFGLQAVDRTMLVRMLADRKEER